MLTQGQKQEVISKYACCIPKKVAQLADAAANGEDTSCLEAEVLLLVDYYDEIMRYNPDGQFIVKRGCDYTVLFADDGVDPYTLASITVTDDDGNDLVIPVGILLSDLTAQLQVFADLLYAAGLGTTLSDLAWAYTFPSDPIGTLKIKRSLKPVKTATLSDDIGVQFPYNFGAAQNCAYIETDVLAGDQCAIDVDVILSGIKKLCSCCPEAGGALECVNIIPDVFRDSILKTCSTATTATDWTAGLPGYLCTLSTNANPYEGTISNCYNDDTFYWAKVYMENYSTGSVDVKSDGVILGQMAANGSQVFFFTPSGTGSTFQILPFSFAGCVRYEIYQSDPTWVNTNRAWIYDPDSGCFIHEPGSGGDPLIYNNSSLVLPGKKYRLRFGTGILAGGPLTVSVGGNVFVVPASTSFDETFDGIAEASLTFTPNDTADHIAVCGISLCEVGPDGQSVDPTVFILGSGSTYIDANGNPILL